MLFGYKSTRFLAVLCMIFLLLSVVFNCQKKLQCALTIAHIFLNCPPAKNLAAANPSNSNLIQIYQKTFAPAVFFNKVIKLFLKFR